MKYLFLLLCAGLSLAAFGQPDRADIIKFRILKMTEKIISGETENTNEYWYDRKGNDSARITYGQKVSIKNTFKNGKIIASVLTKEGAKADDRYEYIYNPDGSYKKTYTDGEFGMQSHEWFNAKNKKIKSQSPDGNTTTYKYDAKGRLVQYVSDGYNQGTKLKQTNVYDSKGRLTRSDFEMDGDKTITTYVYDASGRITRETDKGVSHGQSLLAGTKYDYNRKGMLEKKIYTRKMDDEKEEIITQTYEYEYY